MKTITLISTLLVLTVQLTVNGQTQSKQVNNLKADKINLHVVQHPKSPAKHQILPVLGSVKKTVESSEVNMNVTINTNVTVLNIIDLKQKSEELTNQASILTNNALKFNDDNRIMQLEIAKAIQNEAYSTQKRSIEISFQNSLAEYNFNKMEFLSMLNSAKDLKEIVEFCKSKHAESEYEITLAKEMMQEAYAMPNLAATVGTMSNAEEKEFVALKMQNQAIEKLKTIVLNSITLKDNLVCVK